MRKRYQLLVAALLSFAIVVGGQVGLAGAQADDKPTATEVGVTAKEIRIGVVADVDNPFSPGIFKGAVDGVKAGAEWVNKNGGIGGRKLVVDFYDSKLNANEARNGFIQGCANDFALVGVTALFVTTLDDIINCKDSKGQATGIPNVTGFVQNLNEACADVTFSAIGPQIKCETFNDNPATYQGNQGPFKYAVKQLKGDAHGALLAANDTPDSRRAGELNIDIAKKAGIKADVEASLSARDPQSAFTPIVQAMKADSSNFAYPAMGLTSVAQLRQEAALQGIPTDSVLWMCSQACYDHKAIADTGDALEGELMPLTFLPFEETKTNKMLADFIKYTGKENANSWAVLGWVSVVLFKQAMDDVVKQDGVNGVTRANALAALGKIGDFNAGGMLATANVSKKIATSCYVMVKWENGKYTRVHPSKKGTFDCSKSNYTTVEAPPPSK